MINPKNPCCRLCLNESPLRRSHIYPKFAFKRLKEGGRSFHEFSEARGGWDPRPKEDGFWEYMLCDRCEQRLSRFESDVAREIEEGLFDELSWSNSRTINFRTVESYASFKLFTISILWRSSVAQRNGFEEFALGETHEQRLRSMLIEDRPGEPWEYGCVVAAPQLIIEGVTSARPPLTSIPEKFRLLDEVGLRCVRMIVDGVAFHFVVGSFEAMKRWRGAPLFVQANGRLAIIAQEGTNMPFVSHYLETMAMNDRVAHRPQAVGKTGRAVSKAVSVK
jgi:hypothetical protein